ncbi:MAG TPA: hypothetical protein VFX59_29175 [Polyangiales bacterium]|nr:hypothetical protein [Polyangiales bacterium]
MSTRGVWITLFVLLLGCSDADGEGAGAAPKMRVHARLGSRGNFVGLFEPGTATWRLRMQRPGWDEPDQERTFVFGAPFDSPLVGDWDGDGAQTPGVFRAGTWELSNVLDANAAPLTFRFGQQGDTPVVGDWDGDGIATVGVFRDGVFSLRNANSEGEADVLELGQRGDVPVAGDWNGDGRDTVGVFTPDGDFVLLDEDGTETRVALGVRGAQPVVGDWDDNRRDTVGVRLGVDWTLLNDHREWLLREGARAGKRRDHGMDAERHGLGEVALAFGDVGAIPVSGNWLPATRWPEAPSSLRELFPLAADYQWPDSFPGWADAGVNTVIRVRSENDPDAASPTEVEAWTAKANALGLKMIREPRADPSADNGEAGLLAFLLFDEPDVPRRGQPIDIDPFASIAERAGALRAAGITPRPLFVNFAGWSVLSEHDTYFRYGRGDRHTKDFYSRYVELEDWASQDIYAISQMFVGQNMRVEDALATLPLTFAKLRRWAPDKPQFAYIETSQHYGTSRQLTPGEFRAQLWLAIVGGARGIFYFTANGCDGTCVIPDGTTPEVRAELRTQNARLTKLTHVLQGEINPLGFSVSAAAPLETSWRSSEDGHYILAVNGSASTVERWIRIEGKLASGAIEVLEEPLRTIETVGGYTFRDTLGPYEARVYRFR